ncbi:MAG TPA: hypothetical protein VEL74_12780 [Thermoanaerobaculia bacterium]|nr:hypothetical protein [Thermoanaerobaculia bacterium]
MSEKTKESSGLYLPLNHLEDSTEAVQSDVGAGTIVYHDASGPLPLASQTFESPAGTLIITCSGSGSAPKAPDTIGMGISIDNRFAGVAYVRTLGTETKFFANTFAFGPVTAGTHTMYAFPLGNTVTSADDVFNVSFTAQ